MQYNHFNVDFLRRNLKSWLILFCQYVATVYSWEKIGGIRQNLRFWWLWCDIAWVWCIKSRNWHKKVSSIYVTDIPVEKHGHDLEGCTLDVKWPTRIVEKGSNSKETRTTFETCLEWGNQTKKTCELVLENAAEAVE